MDNLTTATGIGGQKGPINVPTVYNAVFSMAQFWNGRAKDLAEQAAGPVMNPLEMGSHDWNTVADHVRSTPGYAEQFTAAFGSEQIDKDTITAAIAEYEKTLITPDSRFDLYLKGDAKAITAPESAVTSASRRSAARGAIAVLPWEETLMKSLVWKGRISRTVIRS